MPSAPWAAQLPVDAAHAIAAQRYLQLPPPFPAESLHTSRAAPCPAGGCVQVYVWQGANCPAAHLEAGLRAARLLRKYEDAPAAVLVAEGV